MVENIDPREINQRCTQIADQVVPEYRAINGRSHACGGTIAKKWDAAWAGARIALGGKPEDYLT